MLVIKAIALFVLSSLMFVVILFLFIPALRGVRNIEDLHRVLNPPIVDTTAVSAQDTLFGPPKPTVQEELGYIGEAVVEDSAAVSQTQADTAALQRQIEQLTQEKKSLEETRLAALAKLYEAMKPDAAAAILTNLDDRKVIRILNRMKDRQAAKILTSNAMPPERAARISRLMRENVTR